MLPSVQAKLANIAKIERSSLVSRNVTIDGHRTSVRLEPDMWNGLSEICKRENETVHDVCSTVAAHKADNTSLTAAIRVFVMAYFRSASTEDGHTRAGHGPGGSFMTMLRQKLSASSSATSSYAGTNHPMMPKNSLRIVGPNEHRE